MLYLAITLAEVSGEASGWWSWFSYLFDFGKKGARLGKNAWPNHRHFLLEFVSTLSLASATEEK